MESMRKDGKREQKYDVFNNFGHGVIAYFFMIRTFIAVFFAISILGLVVSVLYVSEYDNQGLIENWLKNGKVF